MNQYYFLAIPVILGIGMGAFLVTDMQEDDSDEIKFTPKSLTQNGSPVLGSDSAPITIVEWGDYQCTYCFKFHDEKLGQIITDYVDSGKVKVVFQDFPLNGPDSALAAQATHCADDQGKFWQYHDVLYRNWGGENTGWITTSILSSFANDISLDMDKFEDCLQSQTHKDKVLDSYQRGQEFGITGTPSFVIFNDSQMIKIVGNQPLDVFTQSIDKLS